MLHIKNGKVKGTIDVVVAERLASAPLMRQMDHTLASIHYYIAPKKSDKGCVFSRKSSLSVYLRCKWAFFFFFGEMKWNFLLISRGSSCTVKSIWSQSFFFLLLLFQMTWDFVSHRKRDVKTPSAPLCFVNVRCVCEPYQNVSPCFHAGKILLLLM